MKKLTATQREVLEDVWTTNDPWWAVRGETDGRKVAGRRKTVEALVRNELISVSAFSWNIAWITKKGLALVNG